MSALKQLYEETKIRLAELNNSEQTPVTIGRSAELSSIMVRIQQLLLKDIDSILKEKNN